MSRAFLIVMDSCGIGGAPDADRFFNGTTPDTGANTLGHIARACATGRADTGRAGPLHVPTLAALGLGDAIRLASGLDAGLPPATTGLWGAATETSPGKDTPSGHWEIAGVPVPWDWHYFPDTTPAIPDDLLALIRDAAGTTGTLCNAHASGTQVIATHGEAHMQTGWPIVYTSADSVIQIAAHEESFGLDRLLDLCTTIAPAFHARRVGRVIARPFIGQPGDFTRTANRHDYAIAPPSPTLLDWAQAAGRTTFALGKIGDIFSMRGISHHHKGSDATLMTHLSNLVDIAPDGALTFANFVEFDTNFGHRRDVSGYASALEWFDAELARLLPRLRPGDLMLITADHGNDPTWTGTDHTRERAPVLIARLGTGLGTGEIGHVAFADIGASVAHHLGLTDRGAGESFL
ncbi:phosphopentomutase [Aquicoccus porphyridii]|uniref:Phosphopentomutase n=1 Tax=Aquicoccus porphyridii TaxID=1852029 RepID=A0A5A9ZG91_9RHOB|nr:phosphopentomutase [Aquicoccus porphyridii]KAA0916263.1 phosphopentomutase [Aquicoccus porphyridii]RAI53610.1 phosphopentomutase [Rhodobacteraceae bacterium AsT-22]